MPNLFFIFKFATANLKFYVMSYYYDFNTLDFSRKRVSCNGRSLDKFNLSSLIHEFAKRANHDCFPLCTDIYPVEYDYDFYVFELKRFLSKL